VHRQVPPFWAHYSDLTQPTSRQNGQSFTHALKKIAAQKKLINWVQKHPIQVPVAPVAYEDHSFLLLAPAEQLRKSPYPGGCATQTSYEM
jgi:hypothetical protein